MAKLPVIRPKDLLKALRRAGFQVARQAGSHARLIHPDGRAVTIAIHQAPITKGTLRAIIRDIKLSKEEFLKLL